MIPVKGEKEREEFLAITLSLVLALIKGTAAFWTGTLSLFASALDSLLDFFVSGLNLLSLYVAGKEADADHTYGHEKAEALAGLFQSVIILATAGYLIYSSFIRLGHPVEAKHLIQGMGVIAVSIGISLLLTYRLRKTAIKTGSMVLKSDALHYAMDLYTQGGILVAFVLIRLSGWRWIDPIVTIFIAVYILFQAFKVGREAVDELMDRETSPETLVTVREIVARHAPEVVGMHNFRTRRAAGKRFIQFHVEMKRQLTFEQVHEITEKIVSEIRRVFENAQVIVHPDPEGTGVDESDLM
jgi:ferrous-iron efflux pump FieF